MIVVNLRQSLIDGLAKTFFKTDQGVRSDIIEQGLHGVVKKRDPVLKTWTTNSLASRFVGRVSAGRAKGGQKVHPQSTERGI